tara:strand:- start:8481 stop:10022 length:1542 start_codon:yes stop_codon:yes gene_type:complete
MLKKYSFLIFLPFLLKLIVELVFAQKFLFVIGDFIEDIIFSLLILFLLLNVPCKFVYFKYIILGIFVIYFILEISSILIVESNFSASFMFALLDSNPIELIGFFSSYFTLLNSILIVLSLIIYVVLIRKDYNSSFNTSFYLKVLVTLICIAVLKFTGLIENNVYYNILRGSFGYYQLHSTVDSISPVDTTKLSVNLNNDVLVVVLGESISRNHMQLYNYKRPTTPFLENIRDSLMIYSDVIASDVLTTKVIPKLLTSFSTNGTTNRPDNIIEIFNKSNYDTYWISNQRPIGFHENVISKLVSSCNHIKFLTYKSHEEHSSFDGIVLPELNKAFLKPGKKVIFVHLIGAHFKYSNRYPNNFKKFNSNETTLKKEAIDQYDNAILYNDFIVYSIIQQVKSLNQKSAVLYVSDHGEDVYDESNFSGHSETKITKSMVEIPFLLWTSSTYEPPIDFKHDPSRKFITDDLYSSMGHLLGITYPSINYSKSIFSKYFIENNRIIANGTNYDHYFIDKND